MTRHFRTSPISGISETVPYIHGGREAALEEAIAEQDAEREMSRTGYEGFDATNRAREIAFLESL